MGEVELCELLLPGGYSSWSKEWQVAFTKAEVQILILFLTSCVTLIMSLSLYEPLSLPSCFPRIKDQVKSYL